MSHDELQHRRHSLAHLLAAAVMELWPGTKRTIGPAIENGFYYDFDFAEPISDEDLPKIEEKMRELLPTWTSFERQEVSVDEAKEAYAGNEYKLELIEQFSGEDQTLTLYHSGAFSDLCRGGHTEGLDKIDPKSFTLTKVAGAYWRGDEKNKMLTRIYGLAFGTGKELRSHLAMLEEAKKRDHRKLGKELDLFVFSELVGSGLPLWTPKGGLLRHVLDGFVWELRRRKGYERVEIPHVTKKDLYEVSGHWDKFKDELFRIQTREGHEFAMKPMNCPHHTQIFGRQKWSYRDMPQRYANTTMVYRDEQSGELQGLSRVRSITQDDAHVFCRESQAQEEAFKIWDIIETFYGAFGFDLSLRLSTHDPENMEAYKGTVEEWDEYVAKFKTWIDARGVTYEIGVGEAAFYGPKIDFMATDAIGRKWQVATIQVDRSMPESFDLSCVNEQGENERIVMLHAAIMGSIERFLSILIEHLAGAFPFWLAPTQVCIASLAEPHIEYATTLRDQLVAAGIRVQLDVSNEKVGKKIRSAALAKIPWTIVIGDKEAGGGDYKINVFGQKDDLVIASDQLIERAVEASQLPIE